MKPLKLWMSLVYLVVALPFWAAAAAAQTAPDDLVIYTENYPPLNYDEDGLAQGLSVDIFLEALARAGRTTDRSEVVVVPWARGYTETQRRKNTVLFSTVRTPEREKLFAWVGPIGVSSIVLLGRKDAGIDLRSASDFKQYRYGVVQFDRGEQALLEIGLGKENLVHMNSPLSAAHLLARRRVDLWAYERIVSFWVLRQLGYKAHDFEVVHTFDRANYYYAFHPATNPAFLAKVQQAIDGMQEDGTLVTIIEGHMPGAAHLFLPPLAEPSP